MRQAFTELLPASGRTGLDRFAVAIGGDLPQLAAPRIEKAFAALEEGAGVVLGPAVDGGYYLIGLGAAALRAPIFEDIAWSTDAVLGADAGALPRGRARRSRCCRKRKTSIPPKDSNDSRRASRRVSCPPARAPRRCSERGPTRWWRTAAGRAWRVDACPDRSGGAGVRPLGDREARRPRDGADGERRAGAGRGDRHGLRRSPADRDLLRPGEQRRRRPGARPPARHARLRSRHLPGDLRPDALRRLRAAARDLPGDGSRDLRPGGRLAGERRVGLHRRSRRRRALRHRPRTPARARRTPSSSSG